MAAQWAGKIRAVAVRTNQEKSFREAYFNSRYLYPGSAFLLFMAKVFFE